MGKESRIGKNSGQNSSSAEKLIPVFPLIKRITGLRLRRGSMMEYALSIIADSQPGLNFIGPKGDRIYPNQMEQLKNGISEAGWRWLNLAPSTFSLRRKHKK